MQLYGVPRTEWEPRAEALLDRFRLAEKRDAPFAKLSRGMKRALTIAAALAHRPPLVFLDEPTTGLDVMSARSLRRLIAGLREEGVTVFLTTHYLEEADILADRLAIIDDGRIVAEGTSQSLKQQIAGDVVTLGLETGNGQLQQAQTLLRSQPFVRELHPGDGQLQLYVEHGEESLPAILRVLDEAGLSVRTVALARPTLDDVFLRQTGRSLREAGS
jgi:ABC-2 type transport system ATP-binding protein